MLLTKTNLSNLVLKKTKDLNSKIPQEKLNKLNTSAIKCLF